MSEPGSSAYDIAKSAKTAFEASQLISSDDRVKALHEIHKALTANKDEILVANKEDVNVRLSPNVILPLVLIFSRQPKQKWTPVE